MGSLLGADDRIRLGRAVDSLDPEYGDIRGDLELRDIVPPIGGDSKHECE